MAVVNVQHVLVLNNPATFFDPLAFDIQYECTAELESDLEWKMIYVGSAESEEYDQVRWCSCAFSHVARSVRAGPCARTHMHLGLPELCVCCRAAVCVVCMHTLAVKQERCCAMLA